MAWAVSFGLVNCAFFPAKSVSTTPRAAAHFPQTKIGILSSMTLANASLNGGQPTGVTLSETGGAHENSRVARKLNADFVACIFQRSCPNKREVRAGWILGAAQSYQQELLTCGTLGFGSYCGSGTRSRNYGGACMTRGLKH
jgi:hypothetical protein